MDNNIEKETIVNGLKIHFEVSGPEDGKHVLLMHGWGCNHTTVRSIANCLNDRMRVWNVDIPGHGESQQPPTAWGVEDFTNLFEQFITQERLKQPALIGHSFGGRIAILLASRNKVGKIALVDAAGIKPKRKLKYYLKVYSFKTAKKILPLILGKENGAKIIDAWRGKAGSADYRNSSPIMRAVMSRCVNEDLKFAMPSITSPTLLIWGENDTATPLSYAKTMNRLIPDSGLVAFPNCGHYSFLDNPYGFKAVIREFFKNDLT